MRTKTRIKLVCLGVSLVQDDATVQRKRSEYVWGVSLVRMWIKYKETLYNP